MNTPTRNIAPESAEKAPRQLTLKRTEVEATSSLPVRETSEQGCFSVLISDNKCFSVIMND